MEVAPEVELIDPPVTNRPAEAERDVRACPPLQVEVEFDVELRRNN